MLEQQCTLIGDAQVDSLGHTAKNQAKICRSKIIAAHFLSFDFSEIGIEYKFSFCIFHYFNFPAIYGERSAVSSKVDAITAGEARAHRTRSEANIHFWLHPPRAKRRVEYQ